LNDSAADETTLNNKHGGYTEHCRLPSTFGCVCIRNANRVPKLWYVLFSFSFNFIVILIRTLKIKTILHSLLSVLLDHLSS